jgi:hypothetical protein
MSEYIIARDIPYGWEGIATELNIADRTFWDEVNEEVTRRAIDKTNLVNVKAVAQAHLDLRAIYLAAIPGALRTKATGSTTAGAVGTTGLVTKTISLKVKFTAAHANVAKLDAAATNAAKVHLPGNQLTVTVAAGTLVDTNANKEYVLTLTA